MNTHLKDRDIDRLVSGMLGRKETLRAQSHLEECDSCRKKVSILSGILTEKKSDLVPGDFVKSAVIAEWQRINSASITRHTKPRIGLRLAYGFAAAVIVAISAYFALTRMPHSIYDDGLSAASMTGEVHINNTAAGINHKLHTGDVVSTGSDSSVTLTTESYSLSVESSTDLELAENNIDTGFLFILERGAVTSRSEGKLKYAFICGGYRVTPAGTVFRIEMPENKMVVAVFSGKVVVSGANLKIEVSAGMMWDSDDPDKLRSAETGNIKDAITGKGEYTEKNTEGESKIQDSGNKTNRADPVEIRELKRESREEIRDMRDMKEESREGRQFKGGN